MSSSYRKIDYRLRPSKHIERALFADAFKRLPFFPLEDCQYIGMGSIYFSDFRLFHRALGISKLISIENNDHDKARFEFNKPFSCLSLVFGNTWDELPKLDWSTPALVWLDYDSKLNGDVLSDIRQVTRKAVAGSFFALTVNCDALNRPHLKEEGKKTALDELQEAVGKDRIPVNVKNVDLSTKGTALTYYKIIKAELDSALAVRNQGAQKREKVRFQQIFHIRYSDGTSMLTVGGIFIKQSQLRSFKQAGYDKQPYYRSEQDSLSIDVPLLTLKEVMNLEMIAPTTDISSIDPNTFEHNTKAPNKDVLNYLKTYRFLPNYVPIELP